MDEEIRTKKEREKERGGERKSGRNHKRRMEMIEITLFPKNDERQKVTKNQLTLHFC